MSLEELELSLNDMEQAMSIEKRHRYINVRGKRKQFSEFILHQLQQLPLQGRFLLTTPQAQTLPDTLERLERKFQRYEAMDFPNRVGSLDDLEALIQQVQTATRQYQQDTSFQHRQKSQLVLGSEHPGLHQIPVATLKGVGPRIQKLLAQVGIETIENLLYYFPRQYLDYQNRQKIGALSEGQDVSVIGTIIAAHVRQAKRGGLTIATLSIQDGSGKLVGQWFFNKREAQSIQQQWMSKYPKGADVIFSGRTKFDSYHRCFAMDRPQVELISYADLEAQDGGASSGSLHTGRIVPVYPLTAGLNLFALRRFIHGALEAYLPSMLDPLPEAIRKRYQLLDLTTALQQIHFPDTIADSKRARERLVFDELFYLQARLAITRQQFKQMSKGLCLTQVSDPAQSLVQRFLGILPFELTGAQKRVFQEITTDLASTEPMYRLLHGDVGSGKTVIAALSILVALENGYQGTMMAPTEILAEQHYRKLTQWFTPLGLKVGLFVGKTGKKARRELLQGLLNGQIHVAVGTHALIQDEVEFHNLGLVVIDEQHRFGVRQRTLLKSKGEHPEMLTMTATPIPRSLALTLHGDLDVSKLDELPPGRSPIQTVLLPPSHRERANSLIRQEIIQGRQIYIVFPLIDESETLSAKAATTEYERLKTQVFPEYRIGLLHGKLKPEEKDVVMSAFSRHELDILVATTVVEVGVDVPNATVMVIENADRFGLAQLHQLRGRVGRGQHQSYCILVSSSKTPDTLTRLGVMVETQDGFEIAERDLKIRGPGEFMGTRQSGLPDLLLADLVEDQTVLEQAREAAQWVMETPEVLEQYPQLMQMIQQKSESSYQLMGSG